MYHELPRDASFWLFLFSIDQDLAETTRRRNCQCGAHLHCADYPRKPRGVPDNLPEQYGRWFSFCCEREGCRKRVMETVKRLRPRLLLLDPLVRLHGIDENNAGEVAGLLAYFRMLQRRLDLSVILVHHSRKNAASGVAAGQGLRGSGDLHAFGDSNLYLRRTSQRLILSSEHRAAPASPSVSLELVATDPERTHLEVVAPLHNQQQRNLQEQVLTLLPKGTALTRAKLRESLAVKNERLGEALESLERAGRLCRTSAGWQRVN